MTKSRTIKRVLAAILVIVMFYSLVACGASKTSDSATTTSAKDTSTQVSTASTATKLEPITITMWQSSADIPTPGIQKNPVADEIAKKTGVTLDIITGDNDKLKVLLAGGDLPEILTSTDTNLIKPMIDGNQVIPLDSLIEKYGTNIKKYASTRVDYSRKILSNGQNKVFFLPIYAGKENRDIVSLNGFVGFYGRWDLYKAVGAPEMKNEDDLLKTLKLMQDKNPKTADGKKVYALSAWSDWDLWPYFVPYPFSNGFTNMNDNYMSNIMDGTGENMFLKEDSSFWKSLNFFNKAYKMGIFDPEAFTMKLDNYAQKCKSGQVLSVYAQWWANEWFPDLQKNVGKDAGFELMLGALPVIQGVYTSDAPLGWNMGFSSAISNNCKNPERAMQLLDFFNGTEGGRLIQSGVKGKDWDIIDGKPQPTQAYLDALKTDPNYQKKEGIEYNKFVGLGPTFPCEDGYPCDLTMINEMTAKKANAVDKDYAQFYDKSLSYPGQVFDKFIKEGKAQTSTKFWPVPNLLDQPSDETKKTDLKAAAYMKAAIAKVIMAKDDAAFESVKKKILADLKNMGIEKADAELKQLWDKSAQNVSSFNFNN